ncbi:TIGR02234 family membrane protein [Mycolicibacterium sp. P9-22]|uniref:TIGR02234 family membrane protein n=1 Tax=Mycolicibacterium sp. P9-22 TaxID=2024613 RepID=UPI0011EF92CB|nr:TIGR02234 family membrane protein [Mycolicibacterium sp. P9-22]KAA0115685.1 TIGR02234 family membrane protein [Mycolicibacterium sp. P9-22]
MIRLAQALLVLGALALWGASRLPWVQVSTFDGLGQPKTSTLSGAAWSTALVPLALVLLAAAVAALAVRGLLLRAVAVLVALSGAGIAYLGISQWVVHDIAVRGAGLAEVPVSALVGSQRFYWGAGVALAAAVIALVAAGLLMRSAATARTSTARYVAPAARRDAVRSETADGAGPEGMSERMMWDALDDGSDPTGEPNTPDPDNQGR